MVQSFSVDGLLVLDLSFSFPPHNGGVNRRRAGGLASSTKGAFEQFV